MEASRKILPVYDARELIPDKDHIIARLVGEGSHDFGSQPVVIYRRKEENK